MGVPIDCFHRIIREGTQVRESGKKHLLSGRIRDLWAVMEKALKEDPAEFLELAQMFEDDHQLGKMSKDARDVLSELRKQLPMMIQEANANVAMRAQGLDGRDEMAAPKRRSAPRVYAPSRTPPPSTRATRPHSPAPPPATKNGTHPPPPAERLAALGKGRGLGPVGQLIRALTKEEVARIAGAVVAADRPKRFRFAPSPTGHLHVGGAWIALMNYLAARSVGGEFLLRIEDSDAQRSKPEYTEGIKQSLRWLGIEWDGEIVHQSDPERIARYKARVQELVKAKKAYVDPQGSGAIYFRMPTDGTIIVNDGVKGKVRIDVAATAGMNDFVLQGADGSIKFLLANVVDDGDSGITHVIRGEDHLTNAAKQICLFRALGYPVPEFFHVPLILDDSGHKLSKRKQMNPDGTESASPTTLRDFQRLGYLPDAMMNHLARIGTGYQDERARSLDELINGFDMFSFSTSSTKIGYERLDRRNRVSIARLSDDALENALTDFDPEFAREIGPAALHALVDGAKHRAATLSEAIGIAKLYRSDPVYAPEDRVAYLNAKSQPVFKALRDRLARLPDADWTLEKMKAELEAFDAKGKVSPSAYGHGLCWLLTGVPDGLPLCDTLVIVGRDRALERLANV
jgi:glutamyl-tRNA synthetase